jgi:hypothetical protein
VRWESAQYLALGLALFNIAVTIQSYVSTKLDPAEVLVWMPLTLMLDIGAMLQMVILILEIKGCTIRSLRGALGEQMRRTARPFFGNAAANTPAAPDHYTLLNHALVALSAALFGTMLS